ncbi:MAG: hypothetical protein QOF72_1065, partial [Blastocatellia bacterium]|nr:hypothetical protein [Blastocatellia bacterium]
MIRDIQGLDHAPASHGQAIRKNPIGVKAQARA